MFDSLQRTLTLCWPNKRLWAERDQPLTTTTFIWPTDNRVCNAFELSQISDEKDRMLYANVAAEKLLGFSREDKDAGLWDEGDESGGNGDSATVVSGWARGVSMSRSGRGLLRREKWRESECGQP